MWRRVYLLLVAVRLYFALQPSYIHPDEHYQGPEVIACEVFGWPSHRTWEFTSAAPIRSVFPLSLVYGSQLTLLKWIWEGLGYGDVPAMVAFYTLRLSMFVLSFELEDWALHELLPQPHERTVAITLVASSYVTWTFQTHTFSNSIETLLVLWCLVLVRRIGANKEAIMARSCAALAFLGVLGTFNRITFPAFLAIPAVQLVPHLFVRTLRLPILLAVSLLAMAIGITIDTEFYTGVRPGLWDLYRSAVFTPWNNLAYNTDTANLAQHGLHPVWQHFVANLPQLIGPAFPLVFLSSRKDTLFWSAIAGTTILSCFKHQEARFLLPTVPLLLASIDVPRRYARVFTGTWVLFNLFAGVLFGIYHQGGVIPAQTWISQQPNIGNVFWWRTYSPPRWLLNGSNAWIDTSDLMGMPQEDMLKVILNHSDLRETVNRTLLVAPANVKALNDRLQTADGSHYLTIDEIWTYRHHVGLDDLDFGGDGVWPTLKGVVGRRGLRVWQVRAMEMKKLD